MEDLFKLADNLTKAIKDSKCYNDYLISKENIKKNPELCAKVKEFRQIHMDFQRKKNNGEDIPFDYEKKVSKEYYNITLNEDVKTFLKNEQILVKLVGDIYNRITTECVLEFDI